MARTIQPADLAAAGLTAKSWRDDSHDFVMALDATGRVVYAGFAPDLTRTSWVGNTKLVSTTYVEGRGYISQVLPFTFTAGEMSGWYFDTVPVGQRDAFFNAQQVSAIEGGFTAQATDCAGFKATGEANIAKLRATYGRTGVADDRIIVNANSTLAGHIWAERARANEGARNRQCATLPYPEAVGASTQQGLNFPPPDGTIYLGTGEVPIGVLLNSPTTPTRNEGPWPIGAHSAFMAPVGAWRNGQPAPTPFRFPNPTLWYGPAGGPNDTGTVLPTADTGVGGSNPAPSGPPVISGPIPPQPSMPTGSTAGPVSVSGPPTIAPPYIRDSIPNNVGNIISETAPVSVPSLAGTPVETKEGNTGLLVLAGVLLLGAIIAFSRKGA